MLPKVSRQIKLMVFVAAALFSSSAVTAQWHQDRFIIGTFYDPGLVKGNLSLKDTAAYANKIQTIKDCYFNLLTGMDHTYDPRFIDYKLRLFSKIGLKALLMNEVSWEKKNYHTFTNAKASNWLTTTKTMAPQKRQAFEGYFIFDEPVVDKMQDVKNWVSYVKRTDPGKLAYVNLLPRQVFQSDQIFENYSDTLTSTGPNGYNLDVISYDMYPFMSGNRFKDGYFYTLETYKEKAKGRPVWSYALVSPVNNEYTSNEYQLRFMVFVPMAYGQKGILYFTYETIGTSNFGPGLTTEDGKPLPSYYQAQKMNRFLTQIWGPIVMASDNMGTYHISKQPFPGQQIADAQMLNNKTPLVSDISNENMLFGVFKSQNNLGEYNLMIVNKDGNKANKVRITLKGNYQNKVSASVPYDGYRSGQQKFTPLTATYNSGKNTTNVVMDFDPGEGRILKVQGVK